MHTEKDECIKCGESHPLNAGCVASSVGAGIGPCIDCGNEFSHSAGVEQCPHCNPLAEERYAVHTAKDSGGAEFNIQNLPKSSRIIDNCEAGEFDIPKQPHVATAKWMVQVRGEKCSKSWEISVIREDNKQGQRSWGWFDETKLLVSHNGGPCHWHLIESVWDGQMKIAHELCDSLNKAPEPEMKKGDKVTYQRGDKDMEQQGVVYRVGSSIERSLIFVVYSCNDDWGNYENYTAEGTYAKDLTHGWK